MSKRVYVNPHNDENFLILSANYLKYFFLCNCLQQQAAESDVSLYEYYLLSAIFRPLALLWRGLRTRKLITKGLWIFIDEFQNLSLKEDSVLLEMLCEARKYHVNIVLATQSIAGYRNDIKAALDKTAVHS